MKKNALLLVAIALAASAFGQAINVMQKKPIKSRYNERYDKAYAANSLKIRWQPLGLINVFDMNLTGGLEYLYKKKQSVFVDLGYVFASTQSISGDGTLKPVRGLISRVGHRFYFGNRPAGFVDADVTYKGVRYNDGEQWVDRALVNGVPTYHELMQVNSRKNVWTAEARIGMVYSIHPRGKITIENWLGLGVRWRNHVPVLPQDAQIPIRTNWLFASNDYSRVVIPQLSLGIRLCFDVSGKGITD